MDTRTIAEQYALIAKYMGERISYKDGNRIHIRYGTYSSGPIEERKKYKTSWDELMPVVQKVLKEDAGLSTYQLWVSDSLGTANIGKVYHAVLDFLDYHHPKTTDKK